VLPQDYSLKGVLESLSKLPPELQFEVAERLQENIVTNTNVLHAILELLGPNRLLATLLRLVSF
jgi:hypothetical protein